MSSGFAHFLQRAEGMLCQLHFAKALTPTLCDDGFFSPLFFIQKHGRRKRSTLRAKILLMGAKSQFRRTKEKTTGMRSFSLYCIENSDEGGVLSKTTR